MRRRQTLPHLWLITDPRGGNPVEAYKRMPRGSGVVFRHFELKPRKRAALFERLGAEVRRRGGIMLLAEPPHGGAWQAVGFNDEPRAITVHNRRELVAAQRLGADLVFVAPVFATRSHPGARSLGVVGLGLMLAGNRIPAIALGGMNAAKFRKLNGLKLHGWAAIDAFKT
ncbi:Thiamine phosphate synthase/TenI domain-containing protein [Sphingomonas antarctica]|uniref:thiamine phosphate synthase n=1 Tax=Sphingomonas antarctica TaxID=2040274 RepID=UPI0039EA3A68